MKPKMSILFIGKKSRITRHKLLPIYLRVTIDGERFEVATHRHVKLSERSSSAGKVAGKSDSALDTNMALDEIKSRVYEIKKRILSENRNLSIDSFREKWFGEDRNKRTLLGVFRLSILDLEKLVAKGIYKKSTLTKYLTTERHLINFLTMARQRL